MTITLPKTCLSRRPLAILVYLVLFPVSAAAQQICGLPDIRIATYLNGTWQLDVVAAKVIADKITRDLAKGSREIVTMTIDQSGAGTLKIKNTALHLQVRRPGTAAIRSKPEHFNAFMTAVGTLTPSETAAMQGCTLGTMLQLNARLVNNNAKHDPQNQIELVALGTNLFAGSQVVKVPGSSLSDTNAPDIRVVSALVMRRLP